MPAAFSVIVNTSDGYQDCWAPFFALFQRYWPSCDARVLLNTERASFQVPGLDVESTQVQGSGEHRLTWSECLARCLDRVDTPLVLYLQEDYFLEAPVDDAVLREISELMRGDPTIGQIGLTDFGASGPFHPTDHPRLWRTDRRSGYRTSLQAALWRTDVLRSYLRRDENGWMFEIYGTRRSARKNDLFLTLNRDLLREQPVFPYAFTGIIKGQWHPAVPAFFAREGLAMDFARRGFFRPRPRLLEKVRTFGKLLEQPRLLMRGLAGR